MSCVTRVFLSLDNKKVCVKHKVSNNVNTKT